MYFWAFIYEIKWFESFLIGSKIKTHYTYLGFIFDIFIKINDMENE